MDINNARRNETAFAANGLCAVRGRYIRAHGSDAAIRNNDITCGDGVADTVNQARAGNKGRLGRHGFISRKKSHRYFR